MLREGQIVVGPQFSEPMVVETVRADGVDTWVVGLVGERTQQFRRVTLTREDLQALRILDRERRFDGDGQLLRLGLEAYRIGIAYEFDPYFGLSISRVDPLPHQLEAVYHYLLKLGRVRFLLADDAGAGKTIMAGLLLRELRLRGLVERALVVCPANLTFQWQRELKEKFNETFVVLKGSEIREQFGVNQWLEHSQVITSLDLAKREDVLPGLRQAHWDLVVVDEAHRMSASDPDHKTQRYRLGELLRDHSDHLLLLTATPHKGDPGNFSFFLQLLDQDAFADVRSIREAMERRRAPFYLRRTKEAMVYFPEQQADGTWITRKIFTRRIPRTVDFHIEGEEYALYRDVTRFVKHQSAAAAAREDDPRARAVGFLMALYQRRLASSTYALRRSLENRAERLSRGLERAQELARLAPPQLPGPEEFEETEDADRERLEEILAAVTLAQNAEQVREEIAELQRLVEQAKAVEARGAEAKLTKLRDLVQREGFFDRPDQRLLVFTEFKDTLDYLVARRVLQDDGIGAVVFAHKTTEGWEALLSGLIRAGWTVTASWPITTEMGSRLRARESAALGASVHLVIRPRPESAPVGDWDEVLRELPGRVGDWMERLQAEGIRGADLVFACIGPALEIFSRYKRVETAEGREVALAEFLEKVWEVVGRAALRQVLGSGEGGPGPWRRTRAWWRCFCGRSRAPTATPR